MTDDAFKAAWRGQFALLLHPYSRRTETLIETADKLIAARGFIEPLSHSDRTERENGLFVANVAIRYGMQVLDHFGAAIAIWNYAEASARLIFSEVEATDPLESVLLEKITASPGINRKSLHKALGGHVKAEAMVKALGSLAGQGKVRSEMVPTGGRRSECWWPVLTPSALPLTVESADEPPPDANERTKSDESAQADQSQDSSFVRKGDAHAGGGINGEPSNGKAHFGDAISLSLAELFAEVQKLDGKIVRSADGTFAVEGVEQGLLTPGMVAALVVHRDELALVVPSRRGVSHVEAKPMTFEEQRHAEWLKRYEAAQAKRLAREAELLKDPMSPEEWNREMDEMLERQKRRAT